MSRETSVRKSDPYNRKSLHSQGSIAYQVSAQKNPVSTQQMSYKRDRELQ